MENIFSVILSVLNMQITETGNDSPIISEANETYLLITNVIRNTAMAISVACQCSASSIPTMVATPFPPRKPAKTGNTCPNTAAAPSSS